MDLTNLLFLVQYARGHNYYVACIILFLVKCTKIYNIFLKMQGGFIIYLIAIIILTIYRKVQTIIISFNILKTTLVIESERQIAGQ